MRRVVAVLVAAVAVLAAACAPPRLGPSPTAEREPSSAWVARTRRSPPILRTVRNSPELRDLVLYLEAREAARAGDDATAVAKVGMLGDRFPDSIWVPSARLLAGRLRYKASDLDGARAWLLAARDGLSPKNPRWATATLALADVASRQRDETAALDLVRGARATKLRGVALRRAQRTTARIRERTPVLFEPIASRLAEGELLLGEDGAAAAALEATAVLAAQPTPDER